MARCPCTSALWAALLAARGASAAAPRVLCTGGNFLQAGAVHPASGDVLVLTDPGDKNLSRSKPVSVALLHSGSTPGASFQSLTVLDAGTAVTYPADLAFSGDTALILDQGDQGVAAFDRGASGSWSLRRKWRFDQLLASCDSDGRQFGLPESIAVGPKGEVYVSMAVMYNKPCLLHPFDKCCQKVTSSSIVMRLDVPQGEGQEASLHEVFSTKSFFNFSDGKDAGFHIRALDVTEGGDVVVVGSGDDGGYFGHSAWRWEPQTQRAVRVAGQDCCDGGHAGDGGDATSATLDLPWGVVASGGTLYISEAGNTDVRAVAGGVISTLESAPHGDRSENNYLRRLHRGTKPGTLLLAISGMGTDAGRLVEFDLAREDPALVV